MSEELQIQQLKADLASARKKLQESLRREASLCDSIAARCTELEAAWKERDEAVALASTLTANAVQAGKAVAEGYVSETVRLAVAKERERLARVFEHSAECARRRASDDAQREDYEMAALNAHSARVWDNGAAECRKVPQ